METHTCNHCNAKWHLHVCPKCGKFQLTIEDALSAMQEFLENADWKTEPHEAIDEDGLLDLIRNIQYYTIRDTEPENEFLERIKSLETSVKIYAGLVSEANDWGYAYDDEDEKEEDREHFIENDVKEARDQMKYVLVQTIDYLELCVENEVFVMFEHPKKVPDDFDSRIS